ncbi:hypothetical protein LOK49_LG05G02055 [Camellia lanceoleosa]|uniref:Uncharacterized protein n=1 Tax=Camellia lanceoleosa TaxID=1840588 RepID=A0ACC0HQZ8_9ERIC|nr:hypothetical protein LOK49_LG05G02055 [Camellia lanceoleosa]
MVMVSVMKLMDRVLIVFSVTFAVIAPLDAGLLFLTPNLDPNNNNNLLVHHLKPLYEFKFGDYLVTNKPAFFVALVWLEVVFLWPLQLLNLYGIILSPHPSWLALTFLLFGASYCTAMLDDMYSVFDVDELSSLVKVNFTIYFDDSDVCKDYYNGVVGMLGKISKVQDLELRHVIPKVTRTAIVFVE